MEHEMRHETREPVLAQPGYGRLACSCGKYQTEWLVQTREGIGRMKLAAQAHIWYAGERERQRAEGRAALERLATTGKAAPPAVQPVEALGEPGAGTGKGKPLRAPEGFMRMRTKCYAHTGECCPPECSACTGCRCSCECYICGLEDETAGSGER